jgi:glycine/D-amino acid oxidase-like deaminating enzyme
VLGKERTAEVLGTRFYVQALRTLGSALVQPAALVRGLATSLPTAAELYEESPVERLERRPDGSWRLITPGGAVIAERVLVATDAFTPRLGLLHDRLVPILTFASLTSPLPAELGGERQWGVLPAHKAGSTLRRLHDGRLLIRNSFRAGGNLEARAGQLAWARARHVKALQRRFPALPGIELEATWGGVVCFTRNFAPFFGRLAEGLYAAVGTNGVGIAKGTILGKLMADLSLGDRSELLDDALASPQPAWIPPEPLTTLGVWARIAWEQRAAGPER